ncbi:MAG: hypothetical protein JXA46_04205 [Dehalococcoidales bacterium]|nr:hypothetical protein [Dehalococcoidales bacterium]
MQQSVRVFQQYQTGSEGGQKAPVYCKRCGSVRTRKHGLVEGTQYYFCRDCRHRFSSNDYLFRMKTPFVQLAIALEEYYQGQSINSIRDKLNASYSNTLSCKSVYAWIKKYTDEAISQFKDYRPRAGTDYVICESIIKTGRGNCQCTDIIDRETYYLLSSGLLPGRDTGDTGVLLERARERAGSMPERISVCEWKNGPVDTDGTYGFRTRPVRSGPSIDNADIEFKEQWRSIVETRNSTLERLKRIESAGRFLDGFRVYYNYLRPHERLEGRTPAEKAGVQYESKSWTDVILMSQPRVSVLVVPGEDELG